MNNTGGSNTFIGRDAGRFNTSGGFNTFLGSNAGRTNSSGQMNAFVGLSAGRANTSGSNNTFVGIWAGQANTTAGGNTFFGSTSGYSNTTGSQNTFIGNGAGLNNTTGSGNTFLGRTAGPLSGSGNLTNATAIGQHASVSLSNSLVLGSVSGTNGATATVNVGIGTTAPWYRLHVNGSAAKPGTSTWIVASDRRLKTEVEPYSEGLEQLMAVQPVWFRYNGKAGLPADKRHVGVIAQEMQQIAPHTVGEFTYQDTTGRTEKYLDYDANALTYMLVNAVKELKTENEQLRQELVQIKRLLEGQPDSGSGAKLWQNEPNPALNGTIIRYFIPETAGHAQLRVFSMIGQEIYRRELSGKGEGKVEISQQMIPAGTYIYNLVIDGKAVDSKKMILNR